MVYEGAEVELGTNARASASVHKLVCLDWYAQARAYELMHNFVRTRLGVLACALMHKLMRTSLYVRARAFVPDPTSAPS